MRCGKANGPFGLATTTGSFSSRRCEPHPYRQYRQRPRRCRQQQRRRPFLRPRLLLLLRPPPLLLRRHRRRLRPPPVRPLPAAATAIPPESSARTPTTVFAAWLGTARPSLARTTTAGVGNRPERTNQLSVGTASGCLGAAMVDGARPVVPHLFPRRALGAKGGGNRTLD